MKIFSYSYFALATPLLFEIRLILFYQFMCHLSHYNARQLIQQAETLHANLIVHNICHVA